ncbi:hypothetical protein [Buchnera aphidicola]|uniref:hypothetical protein n=1 Tax=Buchnera aphidicola TaxID=9 RepID=UPI0031B88A1B
MSSILVADKENDILINIKNRIENNFHKKNNIYKDENLSLYTNKNLNCDSFVLNKNDINLDIYSKYKNFETKKNDNNEIFENIKKNDFFHEKYIDDTSSMPMYTFDQDIKVGYDDNIINNGVSNNLDISSLPDSIESKVYGKNLTNDSLYISDDEIIDKIKKLVNLNKKINKENLLNEENIENDEIDDTSNVFTKYESSPILSDILSFGNKDFSDKTPWKISLLLDKSITNFNKSEDLDYSFKYLSKTKSLNPNFLNDLKNLDIIINGKKLINNNKQNRLDRFREFIPDLQSQQLISTYVNKSILLQPYLNLFKIHPELLKFKSKNSIINCEINQIDKNSFKILITDITKLNSKIDSSKNSYNSFGVRSVMIISKINEPILQHLFFVK